MLSWDLDTLDYIPDDGTTVNTSHINLDLTSEHSSYVTKNVTDQGQQFKTIYIMFNLKIDTNQYEGSWPPYG